MSSSLQPIAPSGAESADGVLRGKRSLAFYLNKIKRRLWPQKLPGPTPAEARLAERLRERISALPKINPAEVATPAERRWAEFRIALRSELLAQDPRTFLEFRVIKETMFVDDPPYISAEYSYLRQRPDWHSRWRPALEESNQILVPRCPYYARSSGNLIHCAFHLAQLEHHIGMSLSSVRSVLEFGGGYGGMCRLLRRLGHSGPYTIFDLPEFSALQEFYLSLHGIAVGSVENESDATVHCLSDSLHLWDSNDKSTSDLFIGTWSISETPLKFRESFLSRVHSRYLLIGYQQQFEGLNNAEFFRDWSRNRKGWRWIHVPCAYMPGPQYYLLGVRNDSIQGSHSR